MKSLSPRAHHWVLGIRPPHNPFWEPELAARLWYDLKTRLSDVISAVLMPDHAHLLILAHAHDVADRLQEIIDWTSRSPRFKHSQAQWAPIPDPTAVWTTVHMRRAVRYIALNPCRAEYVRDPLEWRWSTYRGYWEASLDSWCSLQKLADVLEYSRGDARNRLHSYVSSDATVSEQARRPLGLTQSLLEQPHPQVGLDELAEAALSALECRPSDLTQKGHPVRRLTVALAYLVGWKRWTWIAKRLDVSDVAVRKMAARVATDLAVYECLPLSSEFSNLRLPGRARTPLSSEYPNLRGSNRATDEARAWIRGLHVAHRCLLNPRLRVPPATLVTTKPGRFHKPWWEETQPSAEEDFQTRTDAKGLLGPVSPTPPADFDW